MKGQISRAVSYSFLIKSSLTTIFLTTLFLTVFIFTSFFLFPADVGAQNSKIPQGPIKEGKKTSSLLGGSFAPSDDKAPMFVKSKTLTLDSKKRVFTYRDNVEILRDDLTITSDVVVGEYNEKNKVQTITATGNVVITKGTAMKASSNRAVYFVPREVIELTEAPELFREGNILTADKLTIFVKEERSEAEGRVRVKLIQSEEGKNKKGKKPSSLSSVVKGKKQAKEEKKP